MASSLDGTVALVTGASSGIGEATARALAAQGAAVAVVARRKDRLDALAAELGDRALAIEADVTQQDQAIAAVGRTVDELGRLDVVVNNAGVMLLGPVVDAPTEEWDRMVALNVNGLLYVGHAALPHLIAAAQGEPRRVADLVNVSSVVKPGAVDTELASHVREEIRERLREQFSSMERLQAQDIADAIVYVVMRDRRIAVNEILIRPTEQEA